MTTDFRALCAELHAALDRHDLTLAEDQLLDRSAAALRATLADEPTAGEPVSVTGQPSNADLLKLAQQYSVVYLLSDGSACHPFQEGYDMRNDVLNFARAVLAHWGSPAPQPVPVSERLPEPGDCLDEGWAWFFYPRIGWRQAVPPVTAAYTHWLPAHAIPLPDAND